MAKIKKNLGKVATKAAELLKDPKTTEKVKSVAASALSHVAEKLKKK